MILGGCCMHNSIASFHSPGIPQRVGLISGLSVLSDVGGRVRQGFPVTDPYTASSRGHNSAEISFGRSENRQHLRKHFEISAEAIAQAALSALARGGAIEAQRAEAAIAELGFDPEKKEQARA